MAGKASPGRSAIPCVHRRLRPEKGCPRTAARISVNTRTGELFSPSCDSWSCPVCCHRLARRKFVLLRWGLFVAADRRQRVQLLSLTRAPGSVPADAFRAWGRVRDGLRYSFGPFEFASVLHADASGWHLHALVIGGTPIAHRRLRQLAQRAGFGPICDVREKPATFEVAVALAGYLTRQLATDGHRASHRVGRVQLLSTSARWPRPPERHAVSARRESKARRSLRAAQRRRVRHVERSQENRRADLVLAVAAEHGLAGVDVTATPATVRRCFAKMLAGFATHPVEAGITEAAGRTVRAVAGEAFVSEGMAALDIATAHRDDVRDELAARFPAWSPDVVRIATALEPELAAIWEEHRRAAPESIDLEGYPSYPALPLDLTDLDPEGAP